METVLLGILFVFKYVCIVGSFVYLYKLFAVLYKEVASTDGSGLNLRWVKDTLAANTKFLKRSVILLVVAFACQALGYQIVVKRFDHDWHSSPASEQFKRDLYTWFISDDYSQAFQFGDARTCSAAYVIALEKYDMGISGCDQGGETTLIVTRK